MKATFIGLYVVIGVTKPYIDEFRMYPKLIKQVQRADKSNQ